MWLLGLCYELDVLIVVRCVKVLVGGGCWFLGGKGGEDARDQRICRTCHST